MDREELLEYIDNMTAELETAKTYGDDWKRRDWKTRQSIEGGKLCLTVGALEKAEDKARKRPHSKGARKAKRLAKEYRRQIKHLESVIAEKLKDYDATTPRYITTPGAGYDASPSRRKITLKDCGDSLGSVS